jgi:hypothetical protein
MWEISLNSGPNPGRIRARDFFSAPTPNRDKWRIHKLVILDTQVNVRREGSQKLN